MDKPITESTAWSIKRYRFEFFLVRNQKSEINLSKKCSKIKNLTQFCSMALQPSQSRPGIVNLREARIGVIPEGEEFQVMLYVLFFQLKELTAVLS